MKNQSNPAQPALKEKRFPRAGPSGLPLRLSPWLFWFGLLSFSLVSFLISFSLVLATNHDTAPPALTNFQQFYGSVAGLPSGSFSLRAQIGTTQYTDTPISAAQYGYTRTLKVFGRAGDTVTFSVINAYETAVPVGTAPYQEGAVTEQSFQYEVAVSGGGTPAQCGNNLTEGSEVCDGTDLASQTCATQVGTGSTGMLRCAPDCQAFNSTQNFDTSQCAASGQPPAPSACWQCNDWGECRNSQQTRNCVRFSPCTVSGADVFYSEPAEERSCRAVNQTIPAGPSACTMSWECGAWSLCRNAQQTRICFRADNCDTLLTQGQAAEILSIPQPAEQRACTQEIAATQQACSPGLKRCLGLQLQQCSADGLQWATLQSCSGSCDPISLACTARQEVSPLPSRKPSSLWVYLLLGSAVLAAAIVLTSLALLNKKKYAPAKEYIEENRSQGIPDSRIEEKLVEEGWDEKGLRHLFK